MIVKMKKIYLVARTADRDQLLNHLSDWAVVHLYPVNPEQAVADEADLTEIDRLARAVQILTPMTPGGTRPDCNAREAADRALHIEREGAELAHHLTSLHRQVEQLTLWGDIRLEQFKKLEKAGIKVFFYALPAGHVSEVRAECVHTITELAGKRALIAVISRSGEVDVPEIAEEIFLPLRDRPSLRKEAAEVDEKLAAHRGDLAALAHLLPDIQRELIALKNQTEFAVAGRGGLANDDLFALRGWIPTGQARSLEENIDASGLSLGFRIFDPEPDEEPPTAIEYPRWARPIKGLFDILGTLPGYKEFDLSPFFMIALPVFAAMLIGDGGYGLVFLLPPLLLYRKMVAAAGPEKTQLLIALGACTLLWGILTANFFGVTPTDIAKAGGFVREVGQEQVVDIEAMQAGGGGWAAIGKIMVALAPFWDVDAEKAREIFIKISLLCGCLHLILGHLRRALAFLPDQRGLAEIGWCLFLAFMLGVIWILFFGVSALPVPLGIICAGGIIGAILFLLFTAPSKNPLKRIAVGLASSLLPMLGTFSDTMSYIRLMAVGLASYYIAAAFNKLGADMVPSATWFGAAPVIVFGHLLNIALCVIAIFAHGVRLNMLEFSSNAGVQWSGYAYDPFARHE